MTTTTLRGLSLCIAFALAASTTVGCAHAQPASPSTVAAPDRQTGLFDVQAEAGKGRVLLGIAQFDAPFLLISSIPSALGSNDVGLDRGQHGDARLVEFRRYGNKVLLVERNTRFRADTPDPAEARSVREAFAESVLWAGEVAGTADGRVQIDIGPLLLSDLHGIGKRLAQTRQGAYAVDDKRSAVLTDAAKAFPDNVELEALLTFKGPGEGAFVRDVAMDPQSLTLRQHVSLVRLPAPGFVPRRFHPASGAFSHEWMDFAQPLANAITVRVQPRFRLEKTDPTAAVSDVSKPIVFYLDRGTPEPVRSALLEGANWWASAFEKAGLRNAFRAELLPEGADPMDVRHNIITWAHRATRGWSYGQAIIDPRTGEIIKGSVTLGSQRVRQDILIAEALLAPYGNDTPAALRDEAVQMALARLRQLAAHEVGHALGFAHNFAASRGGNASVMDYPHPLIRLDTDGRVRLDNAYGTGVGAWDDFVVAHAYTPFAPGAEAAGLAALRRAVAQRGIPYVSDADARAPGDAHVDGVLWDMGSDTFAGFDALMQVRRQALQRFGRSVLPPDRQTGELEARLVPVYLLHRYQVEGVARWLGGTTYASAQAGESGSGALVGVAAPRKQREALQRLVSTLQAEQLALPPAVLDVLAPQAVGFDRTREYFDGKAGPMFDPIAAASAASANTLQLLLAPQRLNRLDWQHARDAAQPGVREVLQAVFAGTWQRAASAATVPAGEAVQLAANWVVIDAALLTLQQGALHPQVAAQLRAALRDWQQWLSANAGSGVLGQNRRDAAQWLKAYLADPASIKLRELPRIPPGAPI